MPLNQKRIAKKLFFIPISTGILVFPTFALGQTDPRQLPLPAFSMKDNLGVDLASGRFRLDSDPISMKTATGDVTVSFNNILETPRKTYEGWFRGNTTVINDNARIVEHTVEIGDRTLLFRNERAGSYVAVTPLSGTLSTDSAGLVYTDVDGTRYIFAGQAVYGINPIIRIEKRNGEVISLFYKNGYLTPTRVLSSLGWGINAIPSSMTLFNRSVEYCPENADDCTLSKAWPKVSFTDNGSYLSYNADGFGELKISGHGGLAPTVTYSDGRPTITIGYGGGQGAHAGRLASLTVGDVRNEYGYAYTDTRNPKLYDYYISMSNGKKATYSGRVCNGVLLYLIDPLKRKTSYSNTTDSCDNIINWNQIRPFPSKKIFPEGNSVSVSYSEWRPSLITQSDKASTSNLFYQAGYNDQYDKPSIVYDQNRNTSDFEYKNGNVTRESLPLVDSIRPVKRTEYQQIPAKIKNSSGQLIDSSNPVWLKVRERTCMSTATVEDVCKGGSSDEVVTEYGYSPDLHINRIMITADKKSRLTCYGHDALGNVIWTREYIGGEVACG